MSRNAAVQRGFLRCRYFAVRMFPSSVSCSSPANAVPKKSNGDANLCIVVDTLKDTQIDTYEFRVEISVAQDVTMTQEAHSKWIFSETWHRTLQGLTSPDRTDVIEQAVKKCVDIFVADYCAVNPKLPAKMP
jgi:hypothetical protein